MKNTMLHGNMFNGKIYYHIILLSSILSSFRAFGSEYYFDPTLFQGSAYGKNIDLLNESKINPGQYVVDVWVNKTLVKSSVPVSFIKTLGGDESVPCISWSLMRAANLKNLPENEEMECRIPKKWDANATWQFEPTTLRLQLNFPASSLNHIPKGYISPSEWDSGTLAFFLRHNTTYTLTENTASNDRYHYIWSGINSGTNLGLWQVRHQGNFRYVDSDLTGSEYKYNSVRTWIQRPIAQIDSIFTAGETFTDASLFGSLSFNGIKLMTDKRMRPQGRQGYAPEVRGVATTNARVIVKQLGRVIYEKNVPPGSFVIDDLYNTRSQGDLTVDIIEADGKVSTFKVPYSAVPDSVRSGNWDYSLALGKVRQYDSVKNGFLEGTIQRGISNSFTINLGSRSAYNYQALLAGGVWSTEVGAIGLNTSWSSAKVEKNQNQQGGRAELTYSKSFQTGTSLVLGAYRYSTSGFRDLQDVLGVRRQQETGVIYNSDTLQQRNRLSATISQPLDNLGTLNLNASTADYYSNQSRITQLQLGYSNQWNQISYGVNIARQRTSMDYGRFYKSVNDPLDFNDRQKYTETSVSMNISMPLGSNENRSSAQFSFNQSRDARSSVASLSGSAGENNVLSWSAYGGMENSSNQESSTSSTLGGSVQQNSRYGAIRASYGQGSNYRQGSLGTSGTMVLHEGGVTLGPNTSETFALVSAKGAEGAKVINGQGAVIDSSGYAILPSLSPYRSNNVTLDTKAMNKDAELNGGSQRVVPYAGAIARINFETITGKAVLINLKNDESSMPPMGSEVIDGSNKIIGMVGQGGQVYARISDSSGSLLVRWGKARNERCHIPYTLNVKSSEPLMHLSIHCHKESADE